MILEVQAVRCPGPLSERWLATAAEQLLYANEVQSPADLSIHTYAARHRRIADA
jgi:hypothetical protein